jgi:hypothetical protein
MTGISCICSKLLAVATLATLITAIPYDLQPRSLFKKVLKSVKKKPKGSQSAWEAESSAQPDHSTEDTSAESVSSKNSTRSCTRTRWDYPRNWFVLKKCVLGYDKKCAICLQEFAEGRATERFPSCVHWFHADCMNQWNQIKPTCPLCRTVDLAIESNIAQQANLEAERRQQANLEAQRRQAAQHEEKLHSLEGLVQRHEGWILRDGYPHYDPSPWEPLENPQDRLNRLEHLVTRHENWLNNIRCGSRYLVRPTQFHHDEWTSRLDYLEQLIDHHESWYLHFTVGRPI